MKEYLTVEWNDTESSAKGWLVIYNYVKGYTGGGIRMHPDVNKEEVLRLAEAMAYKYRPASRNSAAAVRVVLLMTARHPMPRLYFAGI